MKVITTTLFTALVVNLGFVNSLALPSSSSYTTSPKLAQPSTLPPFSSNTTSPKLAQPSTLPPLSSNTTGSESTPLPTPSSNDALGSLSALLPAGSGSGPLGDLSKACQTTLLAIVTSPEFLKCVPVASLIPLVPLLTDPSIITKFIADPANNYPPLEQPLLQFATLFCPAPKCSDKGVDDAIKQIQDGCKDDLAKKNQLIEIIFAAVVFYPPIKDITCFKDKSKFCWDESILTAIKLPPSQFKITGNKVLDSIAVADPQEVCTNCNKDIVNTFFNFLSKSENKDLALKILQSMGVDDKALNFAKLGVAVKCGQNFEDGKVP